MLINRLSRVLLLALLLSACTVHVQDGPYPAQAPAYVIYQEPTRVVYVEQTTVRYHQPRNVYVNRHTHNKRCYKEFFGKCK